MSHPRVLEMASTFGPTGATRLVVHTVTMWRDPVIEVYKQHVDRTLLRENLRLSVEERFRKLMDLQRFAEELQRAGREARRRSRTP
jgi:hypothetical protein